MADAFTFLGQVTTGFPDYRDTATSRMLVAEPGGSYGIEAIDGQLPVPPADGRWAAAAEDLSEESGAPPGITPPPEVPPVPPVPPLEGSDA